MLGVCGWVVVGMCGSVGVGGVCLWVGGGFLPIP